MARRIPWLGIVLVVLAASACLGQTGPGARTPAAPPAAPAPPPIHFIVDDYPSALAEARKRNLPLFVDAWAPWCHTCLGMRAFVFTDERLRSIADRYVWLSLDTEQERNAKIVSKLNVSVLPTLLVIQSRDERVSLQWLGSLTAPELLDLIDETLSRTGPKGPLAVDTLVGQANRKGHYAECASVAAREALRMPAGTALVDVLRYGIDCADRPFTGAVSRRLLQQLTELGSRVASDPSQPILADDRSDLYGYVVHALGTLGRAAEAKTTANAWASFLESQAAHAVTPSERTVFDAHRLLAYLAIGEPERAVPMLEASERDFPKDYNPPARLASAYLSMKRDGEALVACNRALALAYGPRKLHLYALQADILVASGDKAGARASLRAALDLGRKLTLTGSYPKELAAIRARLSKMK